MVPPSPPDSQELRTHRAQLAHLRHELRTPLNAVIGYSEMLLEDALEQSRAALVPDLRAIHQAGQQLVELVGAVLDPGARGEGMDTQTLGRELRRQLLTPLNAVIGYAEMLLEQVNESGDRDGFAPDLGRIAEAGRSFLAMVQDVEGFLGEAPAANPTLARDAVASIRPLEQTAEGQPAPGGRLLVVDDNPINRQLLGRNLERQGHSVVPAENGRAALELLGAQRFDLVLLDVMMPEMNGFDLLQRLKAHRHWREIPVIMISALDEMDSVVRCIEMGAVDYLPKPFNPVLLNARIGACLEQKRLRDSERENQRRLQQLNEALEVRNRFIRETFGRYLSDEVVEQLLEQPDGHMLGGEKRTVTTVMADLRGFTSISERLPAEDVVNIINIFLEAMTGVIIKHQGTIDEFIGDSILAVFGAPILRDDDAFRAVACAVEMQLAMPEVNRRNREAGYPEVAMGIGINTGNVVVGNIGCRQRTKYGVVGRGVVLTSRIESCTVGGQVLISEATARACGPLLRIDDQLTVTPKGLTDPVTLYQVGGVGGEYQLHLPRRERPALRQLDPPRPVRVAVIDNKRVADQRHEGQLLRASDEHAVLACDAPLHHLDNLRIDLAEPGQGGAELYGKVLDRADGEEGIRFEVAITSSSPAATALLQRLIRGE